MYTQFGLSLHGPAATQHTHQSHPPTPTTKTTPYSYSAAIKACERQKDWQTALRLLDDMRALGLEEPDDVTHGQLMHVLSSSGRWAEVGSVGGWMCVFGFCLEYFNKNWWHRPHNPPLSLS